MTIEDDVKQLEQWIEFPAVTKVADRRVMKSVDRILLELKRLQDFQRAVMHGRKQDDRLARSR